VSKAVTKYLRWVSVLLNSSVSTRKKWVEEILNGIKDYRKGKSADQIYLSDALESEKDFEKIGFALNMEYIKVEGSKEHLGAVWVHPFANPSLLYKHKKLPVLIIAAPGIRLNESILQEVGLNKSGVHGITG